MKSNRKNINIYKKLNQKKKSNRFPSKFNTPAMKPKKSPSLKPKGSVYFKRNNLSYRLPFLITFISLLLLIIVVPTMIVLPFGKSDTGSNAKEVEQNISETDAGPEAISVAVMRTKADTVEDVPLENYIVGVVAGEMPVDFEMEALKAQALAARTFTVSHLIGGNDDNPYDVTDTTQHQVYKNNQELEQQWGSAYEENIEKIRSAVKATEGEILTYNDVPIMPTYFSMSNGYTENSEDYWENSVPYLRSVESPWELDNPKLLNQETFSQEQLEELLSINLTDSTQNNLVISRKESGRVDQLTIDDHTFTGREVRELLGLRSNDFSVKQNNNHFIFTTKGNGHGVGMSQYGANGMAEEGKSYEEIVKYYYQGVEISSVDETAPTLVSK